MRAECFGLRKMLFRIKIIIKFLLFKFGFSDRVDLPSSDKNIEVCKRSILFVVFSYNRALQLDALLRSFETMNVGSSENFSVKVVYRADAHHFKSYEELKSQYPTCMFIRHANKSDFRICLLRQLDEANEDRVCFLVDDIIFKNTFDIEALLKVDLRQYILSLRHGTHLSYSYMSEKQQPLPDFQKVDDFLSWKWQTSFYDWAYLLSLDGHVLDLKVIKFLFQSFDFDSPSSLEAKLQKYIFSFSKIRGLCFTDSVLFNIPDNLVQSTFLANKNMFGDAEKNLQLWQQGKRIDVERFIRIKNKSVHEPMGFCFKIGCG
ncbi:hypothetical protein N9E24_00050 [Alphaproteobacteria bacterium]|nr:hypothetical protein [Alphaproteobacteria bacterium]